MYIPPMSIKVLDHRHFGRKPVVGVHLIKSLARFRVDPNVENVQMSNIEAIQNPEQTSINIEEDMVEQVIILFGKIIKFIIQAFSIK